MALSRSLRAVSVCLALTMPATGCASIGSGPSHAVESDRAHGVERLEFDSSPEDGLLAFGLDQHARAGGLSPAHNTGERVGLIILMVMILPVVFLVDLLTLPFAAPNGHPFHCTTVVVTHCTR